MTLKAKALVAAFYGNAPKYSYWNGCSTGGRQALMEATRFPGDYDGIISGDAANTRAAGDGWQVNVSKMIHANNDAGALPDAKLKLIHAAVLNACDAIDGVKDGLIENPKACHFDPKVLVCKGADSATCISAAQVESWTALTSPGKLSNGKEFRPGYEPGSELMWGALAGPGVTPYAAGHYKYIVYKDAEWDWATFNPDQAIPLAEKADAGLDVTNADVSAFVQHGKMIMYHGWNDQRIAPDATVNYYKAALKSSPQAADSLRLFMEPGMAHCRGGEGPDRFDIRCKTRKQG